MLPTLTVVVIVVLAVALGFAAGYFISNLVTAMRAKDQRIKELEEIVSRQRNTENTNSGLEAAGLISVAEIYRLQAQIDQNNLIMDHVRNQLIKQGKIIAVVRESPRSYPVDAPNEDTPHPPPVT
jgi:hypothetical protein